MIENPQDKQPVKQELLLLAGTVLIIKERSLEMQQRIRRRARSVVLFSRTASLKHVQKSPTA